MVDLEAAQGHELLVFSQMLRCEGQISEFAAGDQLQPLDPAGRGLVGES